MFGVDPVSDPAAVRKLYVQNKTVKKVIDAEMKRPVIYNGKQWIYENGKDLTKPDENKSFSKVRSFFIKFAHNIKLLNDSYKAKFDKSVVDITQKYNEVIKKRANLKNQLEPILQDVKNEIEKKENEIATLRKKDLSEWGISLDQLPHYLKDEANLRLYVDLRKRFFKSTGQEKKILMRP